MKKTGHVDWVERMETTATGDGYIIVHIRCCYVTVTTNALASSEIERKAALPAQSGAVCGAEGFQKMWESRGKRRRRATECT
jgi:hypothetical protein